MEGMVHIELKCLVIVAHPDDETIWMGGLMLRHPQWEWEIVALSRADDPDRAPRFRRAGEEYGAKVAISDLDDSPVLAPLSADLHEIKDRIERMLAEVDKSSDVCDVQADMCDGYDLIFAHGVAGEYMRHERHEQVHRAVREMWETGELTGTPMFFAYEDAGRTHTPAPAPDAQILVRLAPDEYSCKQHIIREIYGFGPDSFETEAAGVVEAFRTPADLQTIAKMQTEF